MNTNDLSRWTIELPERIPLLLASFGLLAMATRVLNVVFSMSGDQSDSILILELLVAGFIGLVVAGIGYTFGLFIRNIWRESGKRYELPGWTLVVAIFASGAYWVWTTMGLTSIP